MKNLFVVVAMMLCVNGDNLEAASYAKVERAFQNFYAELGDYGCPRLEDVARELQAMRRVVLADASILKAAGDAPPADFNVLFTKKTIVVDVEQMKTLCGVGLINFYEELKYLGVPADCLKTLRPSFDELRVLIGLPPKDWAADDAADEDDGDGAGGANRAAAVGAVVKHAANQGAVVPADNHADVAALGGAPGDIVATATEQLALIAAAGDLEVGADLANGDRPDLFRPKIQAAIMKFLTADR